MQARGCYLAIAVTLASTPAVARMRTETGVASWYNLSGRLTASGELFDRQRLTAAHPSLPFGSVIEVKNKRNGRTVLVTVNDRGPHAKARIIDLSPAAAAVLGMRAKGIAIVEIRPATFE
ncbi:MAG TPA: septal ring lytic transglycosylase RlpA family protein [Stellaceae bacterium]|nr:septal ring lytic transglycosylase RlpA family protein [Stellaceae bacterium]